MRSRWLCSLLSGSLALSLTISAGCGQEHEDSWQMAPDVTTLSPDQLDPELSVLPGQTLRVRKGSALATQIRVGDRIQAGITPQTPEGLLVEVERRWEEGDYVYFATHPLPLTAAFESLRVQRMGEAALVATSVAHVEAYYPGLALAPKLAAAPTNGELTTWQTIRFVGVTLEHGDTAAQLRLDGEINVLPRIELELVIEWFQLKSATFRPRVLMQGSLSVEASVEQKQLKHKRELLKRKKLIEIWYAPIPVGPIVVTPVLSVYINAEGKLEVGLSADARVDTELGADLQVAYEPALGHYVADTVPMLNSNTEIDRLSLHGGVELKAGLFADMNARLFGVAGPYLAAGPYLRFAANAHSENGALEYGAYLGVGGEVGFRAEVLGQSVGDIRVKLVGGGGLRAKWEYPLLEGRVEPEAPAYQLTVVREGEPLAPVVGDGIACGELCTATYPEGTEVLLQADVARTQRVTWVGCDASEGSRCRVALTADRTVVARFAAVAPEELTTWEVAVAGAGYGRVLSNQGDQCQAQSTCTFQVGPQGTTLTAVAASGSRFVGWDGCPAARGNQCFLSGGEAGRVEARFEQLSREVQVRLRVQVDGSGTVSSEGITCSARCETTITVNESVTLTATPAPGYELAGWSGCDEISGNTCVVQANTDRVVAVTFSPQQSAGGGGTSESNGCSISLGEPNGDIVSLSAISFSWSPQGDCDWDGFVVYIFPANTQLPQQANQYLCLVTRRGQHTSYTVTYRNVFSTDSRRYGDFACRESLAPNTDYLYAIDSNVMYVTGTFRTSR